MTNNRESAMVVLRRGDDGRPVVWCDPEIADIVAALNAGGVATVASCSGHGHRPGSIALKDGRWLTIAPDRVTWRRIEALFPTDINGDKAVLPAPIPAAELHAYAEELRTRPAGPLYAGVLAIKDVMDAQERIADELERLATGATP